MTEFYRFLRPQEYNFQRNVIETVPNGGICFYVKPIKAWKGDMRAFIGFSTCDPELLFNREVAKKVAKNSSNLVVTLDSFSTVDVIKAVTGSEPVSAYNYLAGLTTDEYLIEEVVKLSRHILQIQVYNQQARLMEMQHKDAIKALKLGERYHDIQQ